VRSSAMFEMPSRLLCRHRWVWPTVASALVLHSRIGSIRRGAGVPALCTTTPSPTVAGFLRRVKDCNNGEALVAQGRPLLVPGAGDVGLVLAQAAAELAAFPDVFRVRDDAVELIVDGTCEDRSNAVANVLERLRASNRVPMLKGWRNEAWPVKASYDSPAALVIERAAGPLLGARAFGCHVNGLVRAGGAHSEERLWVARRAATKPTYPGKLDHIVAGGLAHGELPSENVIKECEEEASIPASLARAARPAGIVEYSQVDETGWGVKRDVIFCYDLEVPADFSPVANDGEVDSFELWPIRDVIRSLVDDNDDWKPNVAVVIIDMLVRRGLLRPEETGYIDLVRSLRHQH